MPLRSIATLTLISCLILSGCSQCSKEKDAAEPASSASPSASTVASNETPTGTPAPSQAPTELQSTDIKIGDGAEATDGKTVSVLYTGTLLDGTKFDSSTDRSAPFKFELGSGAVIAGWDQGVKGMRVGGIRKLVIPAQLAYGDHGVGVIPPNSALVFEIELLKVE